MRPVKQAGVVTTHSLLFFAPAASLTAGAGLLVTHVTRFAFMFLSAAMLVYAYPVLRRRDMGVFWRRRFKTVGLPYATWTLVYFLFAALPIRGVPAVLRPIGGPNSSPVHDLAAFAYLLVTGYYQLYYLVVLLEFYAVYPLYLWVLRRTEGHHRKLLGASAALQVLLVSLIHWAIVPEWMQGFGATRELWDYQFFLVAGGVMALHYDAVHAWLVRRWRLVVAAVVVAAAGAEVWYAMAASGAASVLAGKSATDPFQPVVLPLFVALIAAIYLLGVALTSRAIPARLRSFAALAADNSYGIYLSQVLFLVALMALGWGGLGSRIPWPLVVAGAVIIVYFGGLALTSLLAWLPGAAMTAGRAPSKTPSKQRDQPQAALSPITLKAPLAGGQAGADRPGGSAAAA